MRKDELKKHNASHHNSAEIAYVGQLKSRSVMDMFCSPKPPNSKRPRTAEPPVTPTLDENISFESISSENPSKLSTASDNQNVSVELNTPSLTPDMLNDNENEDDDNLSIHSSVIDDEETELLTLKHKSHNKRALDKIMQSLDSLTLTCNNIMRKVSKKVTQVPYSPLKSDNTFEDVCQSEGDMQSESLPDNDSLNEGDLEMTPTGIVFMDCSDIKSRAFCLTVFFLFQITRKSKMASSQSRHFFQNTLVFHTKTIKYLSVTYVKILLSTMELQE